MHAHWSLRCWLCLPPTLSCLSAVRQAHTDVDFLRLDTLYALLHNSSFLKTVNEKFLEEAQLDLADLHEHLAGTPPAHHLSACILQLSSGQTHNSSSQDMCHLVGKSLVPLFRHTNSVSASYCNRPNHLLLLCLSAKFLPCLAQM